MNNQDQHQDLELEAIKDYPFWPDDNCTGIYKDAETDIVTAFNDCGSDLHNDWQLICTRAQHIRRRMKMFEGAWIGLSLIKIEGVPIPRPTQAELDYIEGLQPKLFIGDTAQQLKDGATPWVPEIGQEIEYLQDPNVAIYTPAIYCGYVDGDYIVKHHKEVPTILTRFHNKPERMRPLKTEAEKERKKLIALIRNDSEIEGADGEAVLMLDLPTAERLIDSGWIRKND